jgi:hypothetical protein
MGYGDLVRNASDKMYGLDLIDIGSALGDAEKKLGKTNTTIENFKKNSKNAIDSLGKVLASDTSSGDGLGIKTDIAMFGKIGTIMKEAGESTDYLAKKYSVAKQGFTDLGGAIEAGKLDDVVQEYIRFSQRFGESNVDITRNAALLKQGFADASQVTAESVSAIYNEMKKLGESQGISDPIDNAVKNTALLAAGFNSVEEATDAGVAGVDSVLNKIKEIGETDKLWEGLSNDEVADKITEIARAMDLIPENRVVSIDAEGNLTGFVKDAEACAQYLKEIGKTTIDFDFNTTNLDNVEFQIAEAKRVLDTFKNEDGTININAEGAVEAQAVLANLIALKQSLSGEPAVMNVDASKVEGELGSAIKAMQQLQKDMSDYEIKAAIGIDTSDIQSDIQNQIAILDGLSPEIKAALGLDTAEYEAAVASITSTVIDVNAGVKLDEGSLANVQGAVAGITAEMLVKAGLDKSLIDGYTPEDKEATVTYTCDHSDVDGYDPPNLTRYVTYKKKEEGKVGVDGTAHANGTAFAGGNAKHGNWGTKDDGVALGGELGEELIVRDGKFFTIGSDSAEFFAYRKGDIIFNAEQTKQIFEKGKITHGKRRGSALADGNAFAQGNAFEKGTEDPTEAIINRINLRAHELEQQESQIENDIELAEINKDSAKQASLTNDLLTTRRQRLGELASANIEISNAAESVRSANPAYDTSTWFNSQGEATEAYYALYNSANETQQESIKKLFDQLSKYKKAWADNEEEIDDIGIQIARGEKEDIPEIWEEKMDDVVSDIEHKISLRDNATGIDYQANIADYKKIQEIAHERAEAWRAAGYGDDSEEVQKWQDAWWDAQETIDELDWENSSKWIEERNNYNDWALYGDSEIEAWERVIDRLSTDYLRNLDKIKEAELNLFEARKKEFDEGVGFANTYLESQKTLLQAHYDVENSIAEARHEINKELETSMSMYEYLDEETRQLLFNQEDYNKLCKELNKIENDALTLRKDYNAALDGATLETIESITSNYEMQYQTLMKSYEVAKADLEVAKKKAKLNNVLNERNVRMFVNGSWQWVANTEDVANAKAELADAEYAKQVEEAGLTQKEAIDNLTKQQNELGVVIKQFENGVINLDTAVYLAERAMSEVPSAIASMFNNAKSNS